MKLDTYDLNKRPISREERMRLQFQQRNFLLSFFLNKSIYSLQELLKEFAEKHEGDCFDNETGNYCDVCIFVENNDVFTHINMWCECGHPVTNHSSMENQRCHICECDCFREMELNHPKYKREHNYRPKNLNCKSCGKLNENLVYPKVVEKVADGLFWICIDCKSK